MRKWRRLFLLVACSLTLVNMQGSDNRHCGHGRKVQVRRAARCGKGCQLQDTGLFRRGAENGPLPRQSLTTALTPLLLPCFQVAKITENAGVDIIIDFIGASYWKKNIASLARDGRMVLLGLMGGAKTDEPLDLSQLLYKRLRIEGKSSGERSSRAKAFNRCNPIISPLLTPPAFCRQEPPCGRDRSSTKVISCKTFPKRLSTRSLRGAKATRVSTW